MLDFHMVSAQNSQNRPAMQFSLRVVMVVFVCVGVLCANLSPRHEVVVFSRLYWETIYDHYHYGWPLTAVEDSGATGTIRWYWPQLAADIVFGLAIAAGAFRIAQRLSNRNKLVQRPDALRQSLA